MTHFAIDQALDLSPEKTAEAHWAELEAIFDDNHPEAAEKRHALNKAVASQTKEFRHHNIEFGYTYDSEDIVSDGTDYTPLSKIRIYAPSTRPGHPLPHAYVERSNERIALSSLVGTGKILVLAPADGQACVDAANELAKQYDLPIVATTVGENKTDYVDVRTS